MEVKISLSNHYLIKEYATGNKNLSDCILLLYSDKNWYLLTI